MGLSSVCIRILSVRNIGSKQKLLSQASNQALKRESPIRSPAIEDRLALQRGKLLQNYVEELFQIFGRLPRKSSKSTVNREFGSASITSPCSSGSKAIDIVNREPVSSNHMSLLGPDHASSSTYRHGNKILSAVYTEVNGNAVITAYEALPGFRDVPNSGKQNLFFRKLNLWCVVFDFIDPSKNINE